MTTWAATDIGLPLGATFAIALCANRDGTVIFGASDFLGTGDGHAFRWTLAGGFVDLGTLPTTAPGVSPNSIAYQCSDDGDSCIGYSSANTAYSGFPPGTQAFHWTSGGGMVALPFLTGGTNKGSAANGISRDGLSVTGTSTKVSGDPLTTPSYAFRWSSGTGTVQLGTGEQGIGQAVNNGGTVFVGGNNTGSDPAYAWPPSGAPTNLVPQGTAYDVTPDGTKIVGGSIDPGGAWYWTMAGLVSPPGQPNVSAVFLSISTDGNTMVGTYSSGGGHAMVYTVADGFQTLPDPGVSAAAEGISGDGLTIVGRSFIGGQQHVVIWRPVGGHDVTIDLVGVQATAEIGDLTLQRLVIALDDLKAVQMPQPGDHYLTLRYSYDGGANWSEPRTQTLGGTGQYLTDVQFRNLSISRSLVIELSWSSPLNTALSGVFLQGNNSIT